MQLSLWLLLLARERLGARLFPVLLGKVLWTTCVQFGENTDYRASLYMLGVHCEIDHTDLYESELSTSGFAGGLVQFGKDLG
jgi:hypothetical protein